MTDLCITFCQSPVYEYIVSVVNSKLYPLYVRFAWAFMHFRPNLKELIYVK